MEKAKFQSLVEEAVESLPTRIKEKLENVAIVIEGLPDEFQRKSAGTRAGSLLLGLYQGVPQSRRGPGYSAVLPDKITIFQRNIEAISSSEKEIVENTKIVVWHEIAHHFGFSEPEIRKLEQKWRLSD